MGKPIAKQGDAAVGVDMHVVMVSSPGGPVPTPLPSPFDGKITQSVSTSVLANHKGVATEGSIAQCTPHIPAGGPFQKPPANQGSVSMGSNTVLVDHKKVARAGDPVKCCNDPADRDSAYIVTAGTVLVG